MEFKQFINKSGANTREEIIGLTVYYLMMYGGEETVESGIVHDLLDTCNFGISRSAIALKLKQLEEGGDLRLFERSNAPSGYIFTQDGMDRFEVLAPPVKSTGSGYKVSTRKKKTQKRSNPNQWDVFISHASEDKDAFVEPLANTLEERGLQVWYDDFQLSIGDSIPEEIEKGLSKSEYGVVVLSRAFFKKNWPQEELQSLTYRNVNSGYNHILPIWYNIGSDQVADNSPLLAARMAIRADGNSIEDAANHIIREIKSGEGTGEQRQFDPRTLDYLAKLIAKTWAGDDLNRIFERQGLDVDWDAAKEGALDEYIATFPVEAKERGINLESARESNVRDVLQGLNQDSSHSIEDFLKSIAHPKSHIGNEKRQSQIISDINAAIKHEGLKITSEGEITELDSMNDSS